jgi:hypothetical protein
VFRKETKMFQDVVILNGPVRRDTGVLDLDQIKVRARPLGRPYAWDNGRLTNGGFLLVFECEDGTVYIQEIEWEVDAYPTVNSYPRTCYYYEKYASLEEAKAGGRGWLVEQLRYEEER